MGEPSRTQLHHWGVGAATVLGALVAAGGAAAQSFTACYVPQVGAMYLINRAGLPTDCLAPGHVEITWADGSAAGDITGVTAGAGLTGGGTAGDVALAVAFGGTGAAATAARSDHTHGVGVTGTAVGTGALGTGGTGSSNTALGRNALGASPSGSGNTAVGYAALLLNNSGEQNTAVGANALDANTGGYGNTAVGSFALSSAAIAGFNTAVGSLALGLTTGSDNVAVGYGALDANTTGLNNTAVGTDAFGALSSGNSNTAVGHEAGDLLTSGSENVYIHNRGATESNTIRIGRAAQVRTFIAGIRGRTTGFANAIAVLIDSDGQLGTVSSSRDVKDDIRDLGDDSRPLLALRPVAFRYREPRADGSRPLEIGLIAEEVETTFPQLVAYDAEGRPESVRYHALPVLLLNELQRQERALEALRQTVAEQAAALAALRAVAEGSR